MAHSSSCSYHSTNEGNNQVNAVDSTNLLFSTKNALLNKQQPSAVIDRLAGVVATSDGPIKGHNGGNGAIDFFCGFFLVWLDVSRRVGANVDVVHHPAEDGM